MENQEQEQVQAQEVVDSSTSQEQEAAVIEQAVEQGEIPSEYGLQDDGVYKINLDEPLKQEDNAEITNDEQGQEADNKVENKSQGESNEQAQEEVDSETADEGPLQQISDQEQTSISEEANDEPKQEIEPEPQRVLPEDVDKLVAFMEETGGSVQDYVNLNRDVASMDPVQTIREYYKTKYPHMSDERITRKMNKNFLYTEEDDADVAQDKKDLFEDELFEAQKYLNNRKEKYYADLKLRSDIPQEYRQAYEYQNKQKQTQEQQNALVDDFQKKTAKVFGNEFKGFDFNVGDKKYRYKVSDPKKVQDFQSDISNFVNGFVGEDGKVSDPAGYHRALFAAQNADKLAKHFYEQGRSDAIQDSAKKAKNINMDPRSDGDSIVTSSGQKVRVVSGDSGSKLRMKNFRNL